MDNLHDIQTERVILSTAITNKNALNELVQLEKEDFCDNSNQIVFSAMQKLNDAGCRIDSPTLRQSLQDDNNYKKIGGDKFLVRLISENTTVNYKKMIEQIREYSNKRKIYTLNNKVKENISNLTIDEIDEKIKQGMSEIQLVNIEKLVSAKDLVDTGLDRILESNNFSKTGIKDLDHKINGLYDTELIVLGARPSVGKSALALQFAKNMAAEGKKVIFFSLEMPNKETMLRILADKSNYPLNYIRKNNLNLKDKEILKNNLKKIAIDMPYLYLVDNAYNLSMITSIIKKHTELHDIDAVFIDYLQLIEHKTGAKERHLQIGEITRRLKILANDIKIPIVVLSQLNRAVDTRTNKVPLLSDLRESGSIEQDANVVLFLHQDEDNEKDIDIIVAKARNGEIGRIRANFQKAFCRFSNM